MSPYKTNARILLVEDDPVVALLELRSLRENGYTVEHASSGRAAIEFVHPTGDSFDLILMDIDLGVDMDGVEAARQILERGDIPILFHSSHTDPEVIARTEEVTSYGYVVKNTGMIVLDTSIKMALRLAHSRKQQKEHELALQVSERELRQAYDILRLAIDTMGLGIGHLDRDANLVRWNQPGIDLLSLESASQSVDQFLDRVLVEYRDEARQFWKDALASEGTQSSEMRIQCGNNTLDILWSVHARRRSDDRGPDVTILCADLTDVRNQDRRHRERENYFAAIFDCSLNAIVVADDSGTYIDANPAACDLFQLPREVLIGSSVARFVRPSGAEDTAAHYKRYMEMGEDVGEFSFVLDDGSIRTAQYHAVRIDKDFNLSILSDITDRKEMEQKLALK
ncbi:MAG: PAS domain S-box protein [Leptospiraceae bacterium]|nr:PAS domain S-box protein [Leptospiraceae bacterium]